MHENIREIVSSSQIVSYYRQVLWILLLKFLVHYFIKFLQSYITIIINWLVQTEYYVKEENFSFVFADENTWEIISSRQLCP